MAELVRAPGSTTERVALVAGTGAYLEYLDALPDALDTLRATGSRVRILFLDASDELTEHAKRHLAANKYPREITIVPMVPLTSVGKLDRKKLREWVRG